MTAPLPFTLPAACRTCRGDIAYSGRGRRPTTCSPACKRALRADDVAYLRASREEENASSAIRDSPFVREWRERLRRDAADRSAQAEYEEEAMLVSVPRRAVDFQPSATFADEPEPESDLAFVGVELTAAGTGWSTDTAATARTRDPAAVWLAEHHPGELADFPIV